jgi:hypothetical protein
MPYGAQGNFYGTVEQFYSLLSPPDSLWPSGRIRSSSIAVPVQTVGTTTNKVVDVSGIAHGTYSLVLRCASDGQLNRSAVATNPGQLPTFQDQHGRRRHLLAPVPREPRRRYRVHPRRGDRAAAGASVAVLGLWHLHGRRHLDHGGGPSPDVITHLEQAASQLEGALSDSLKIPLTTCPAAAIFVQGALALWTLIRKCGLDDQQDYKIYHPQETRDQLTGTSPARLLDRWRQGEDIKIFDGGDEGATRFPKWVQPTPFMKPYLPI